MRGLVLAACLGAAACSRSAPAPAPTPRKAPDRHRDPAPPPDVGPAGDPGQLITTRCVLHAGGGEYSASSKGGVTRANCWFNAECVAKPGEAGPGDGFVGVSCNMRSCGCEWTMARNDHPGAEARKLTSTFTIKAPCRGDMGKELLVERCIGAYGLKVHPLDSP